MSNMLEIKGIEGLAKKIDSQKAGYMELSGATKDAGCQIVHVEGGVSKKLGCCNFFEHEEGKPLQFRCGTCEYLQE